MAADETPRSPLAELDDLAELDGDLAAIMRESQVQYSEYLESMDLLSTLARNAPNERPAMPPPIDLPLTLVLDLGVE
jgi:hypothetical protein